MSARAHKRISSIHSLLEVTPIKTTLIKKSLAFWWWPIHYHQTIKTQWEPIQFRWINSGKIRKTSQTGKEGNSRKDCGCGQVTWGWGRAWGYINWTWGINKSGSSDRFQSSGQVLYYVLLSFPALYSSWRLNKFLSILYLPWGFPLLLLLLLLLSHFSRVQLCVIL